MRQPTTFADVRREIELRNLSLPLRLEDLAGGPSAAPNAPWEVEIGFGKGRYLLDQAAAHPDRRYLGVELVAKYFRLAQGRARRRQLGNLVLVRAEALFLLSAVLPRGFASRVHVYFPDPWPKSRHHKRRLFDPETVDLVLGLLRPDGELFFATDFLDYGHLVLEILRDFPGLIVEPQNEPWPGGARTNYEAKYIAEGRPILRLRARFERLDPVALHPRGKDGVLAATAAREAPEAEAAASA